MVKQLEPRAAAVVLNAFNAPLALESASVPEPDPGAVVARVDMAGVCGTDVHLHHGYLPIPLPSCLGMKELGVFGNSVRGSPPTSQGTPSRLAAPLPGLPISRAGGATGA